MRLKEDVVFGKTQAGKPLYIVGSDDQRISFIVVPISENPENMAQII